MCFFEHGCEIPHSQPKFTAWPRTYQERREAERRREEMEASWQHRLAEAEQALKTGHAEWQQERERLFRTQQE